jgi:hypothetical protein
VLAKRSEEIIVDETTEVVRTREVIILQRPSSVSVVLVILFIFAMYIILFKGKVVQNGLVG